MAEGGIRCFHFDSCGIDGDVFELLGEFDQKLEDFPQRLDRARELLDHVPAAEREVGEAPSILQAPDCFSTRAGRASCSGSLIAQTSSAIGSTPAGSTGATILSRVSMLPG